MATVRREGDWRLEKRRDGVYEITFRKEPQLKIFTADSSSAGGNQPLFDTIPTREVASYSEAEGLFEEKSHGPPPLGMTHSTSQTGRRNDNYTDDLGEDVDLSDLPPGGIAVVFLLSGLLVLYTLWDTGNEFGLLLGMGLSAVGILILSYGAYLFRTEGWREAWNYLVSSDERDGVRRSSTDGSKPKKTPPAPQSLKNELFFERANRRCEYCGEEFDQPDVHHITPRSEGGPNEPNNLIVLCPNCHRKADSGAISKSKLRYKIKNS